MPSQNDRSLITPEDVNRAVDSTQEALQARQDQSSANSEAKRNAALQVNAQQQQDQLIETYIQSYTGEDYESASSLSASNVIGALESNQGLSSQQKLEALLSQQPQTPPVSTQPASPVDIYQSLGQNKENSIGLSLQA